MPPKGVGRAHPCATRRRSPAPPRRLGHVALLVTGFGTAAADTSWGSSSGSVLTAKKPLEIRVPPDSATASSSVRDHVCSTSTAAIASPGRAQPPRRAAHRPRRRQARAQWRASARARLAGSRPAARPGCRPRGCADQTAAGSPVSPSLARNIASRIRGVPPDSVRSSASSSSPRSARARRTHRAAAERHAAPDRPSHTACPAAARSAPSNSADAGGETS